MLWSAIIKNRISHVHYPVGPSTFSYIHSFVAKTSGVSYSTSIVNSTTTSRKQLGLKSRTIWDRTIKKASKIDMLSNGILKNIKEMYPTLPPHSISPCSFSDYTKSKTSSSKNYDFVLMSRMVPKKGHDLFLDALEHIKKFRNKNTESISNIGIFGSGPLLEHIKERTKSLPDFNIEIGYSKDPFEIFSKTKFFLSLQEKENYPSQSILEAMSCGAIVIATDVGETEKIVPDGIGYRTQPDAEALAKVMLSALDAYQPNDQKALKSMDFVRTCHSLEKFSNYFYNFLECAARKST